MDRQRPGDVVRMLMTQRPDIERDVRSSRGTIRRNVLHCVFECPRGEQCKVGGQVVFEKNTGFTNPFKHLKSCVSDGDESHLFELFRSHRDSNRLFGGSSKEKAILSVTKKEQAMYGYLRLIVTKSLPVSYVSDPALRAFSKYEHEFGLPYTKRVIAQLTKLVEGRIAKAMAGSQGAILHDGWSHNGMHFFGVFASFMREVTILRNGSCGTEEELCMPLLSVSPLPAEEADDRTTQEEAESFDAEAHHRHLEEIFKYFDQDVSKWVLCSIADNCSVNKRLARLLRVPHVGCMSHKLNSEVKEMVRVDKSLERTVTSVHETMSNCKRRLTNRAMLRNLTDLSPVLPNATRWSGIKIMLNRFIEIRDDIITVANTERASVFVNQSDVFKTRVKRYACMLSEIDTVTKELQKRGINLADCRFAVDVLLEAVQNGRNDSSSAMFGCRLGSQYLAPDAATVTDPHFESGVVKIQNKHESTMTELEKNACKSLLMESSTSIGGEPPASSPIAAKLATGKRRCMTSKYRNCGFIVGSAAEVERLWSVAKFILSDYRMATTPELFESLIFLKINAKFWDVRLVSEAVRAIRVPSEEVQAEL
eukprot:IDg23569t1